MKKRHLKAAAGFIVLCMMLLAMIGAAAEDWHLPLMSLNAGTPLTGESFSFSWEKWSGADYYEYSVVDRTSGETIRNHKRTTGRNGSVSSGNLEYGHHLHIWVGAYIDDVLSAQAHGDVYVACGMHEYVNGRCACGEVCDHDWNSKGICKECEMECPHDDTYEKETSITGVSISDTKHELTTTYNEVCWDCYVIVRKGLTKTSTGKHQLDSNGDCTQCDFGSGCAHEKTKHVERTTSYEYLNDDEHRVKVVYDVVCANANCGRLIEYGGYITSEKEAHSFKSGACQNCGFSIASPLSATVSRSASTISLGKNITGRCVATGGSGSYEYAWGGYMGSKKYFSQYYSSESFYTFAPNKVGTWKIHVYVRDKETGDQLSLYTAEFTVTDAVVECTHASYTDVPRNTSEYVKISDSSHKVVTKVDRVCDDCGEVINTTDKVETQAHSYSGGKCTLCGSAQPTPECAHSSMKSTEISRKVRKTDSNAEHVIDITWKDVCASCGETLNTTRTTYIAENHSFDANGVCKCGYVKPSPTCDHADAQKVFVSSRTERSDAQRHVVITTYRLQCPCGVIVNPSLEERAHFPHTFENSKCIHCGEEQVITPPPVTAPPVTPAPEDVVCTVHGTAHVLDYTGYEAVHPHKVFRRCDCGYASYTGETRPVEKCEVCFPTPTPEPTATPLPPMPMGPQIVEKKDPYQEALKEFGKDSDSTRTDAGEAIDLLTSKHTRNKFSDAMDIARQNNKDTGYFKSLYRTGTDPIGTIEGIVDHTVNDVADRETQKFLVDLVKNMLVEKPANFSESDAHKVMMAATELGDLVDDFNDNVIFSDETVSALVDSLAVADPKQQELVFSWVSKRPQYNKMQVSGGAMSYAGDAASFLLDGANIYLEHKEEYAHLLALTVQYEENMKLLDDIIAISGENSSLGRACLTVQDDMTDALNDVYGVSDSSKIKMADSVVRNGVGAMSTAMGNSPAGGVVNAVLLAGDIGAMLTPNASKTADLEDELVMLSLIDPHMHSVAGRSIGTESAYAVMSLYVDYLRYGTEVGLAYYETKNDFLTNKVGNFISGKDSVVTEVKSEYRMDIDTLNRIDRELQDAFDDIYASQKFEYVVGNGAINPATGLPYSWEVPQTTNAPQATKEPAVPSKTYVVITDRAILRFGPEINSEYAMTVDAGTRLEYLGTAGSWYKVLDPQGRTVYVTMSKAVLE